MFDLGLGFKSLNAQVLLVGLGSLVPQCTATLFVGVRQVPFTLYSVWLGLGLGFRLRFRVKCSYINTGVYMVMVKVRVQVLGFLPYIGFCVCPECIK